jgi:hypothetical protein
MKAQQQVRASICRWWRSKLVNKLTVTFGGDCQLKYKNTNKER